MGFTRNFNYCMDSARYSSYRFAKILGVNLQSVSNWKNGAVVPHPKTRQKIADHFGITLAELDGDELPVLPEDGAKKARPVIDEARYAELTDKEKQVLTLFHQIPEQEWDNMILAVEVALRSKGLLK